MSHILYKINANRMSFEIREDVNVTISCFSSFDESNDESLSITYDFEKNDFKRSIDELRRSGTCKIVGKDCVLAIDEIKDGHGYSFSLNEKSAAQNVSFEDANFDPAKLNFL